jgi:hypothetical protein
MLVMRGYTCSPLTSRMFPYLSSQGAIEPFLYVKFSAFCKFSFSFTPSSLFPWQSERWQHPTMRIDSNVRIALITYLQARLGTIIGSGFQQKYSPWPKLVGQRNDATFTYRDWSPRACLLQLLRCDLDTPAVLDAVSGNMRNGWLSSKPIHSPSLANRA